MRTTFQGLSAQMKRLNVISENIANANRIADPNGDVYKKKTVLETGANHSGAASFRDHMALSLNRSQNDHIAEPSRDTNFSVGSDSGENSYNVVEENRVKKIYDPSNPKADKLGYIRMPDINIVEEMVDLVSAGRTFDANANVLDSAKTMAKKAMEI